jgi:prephenate dehydrogenase
MSILFNNVTIIGVGLIGGSLAKVLRTKNLAGRIIGAGRSRTTLELALKIGVIDGMGQGSAHAVEEADLVVLASPVGTFEAIVREIAPHLRPGAILTDVGSVKGALIRQIEDILPPHVQYVPAHPIAGREKSGVAESTETLFEGRRCILTPTARTDRKALESVRDMWTAAGAAVTVMDADLHDRVFAAVSHLPHVAAFAMMSAVADLNTGTRDYLQFSGAGFRDFTRIAASSPEMWRDICLMNRDNLVQMIDRYVFSLNRFKRDIAAGDGTRLEKHLKLASDVRRGLE